MREAVPNLTAGAFAENLVTSGIDYGAARVGDRLQLGGSVLLEVSQIGKECHTACAIGQAVGDCIMPREGIFCRVLAGGCLRAGDRIQWVPQADPAGD
jgi:MOSC domain-containing protein YiiM